MARNEARALADLAAETLDVTVTTPVQGMHEAIAARVFRSIGPSSEPARLIHDGIAATAYGALRRAGAAAHSAAGAALDAAAGSDGVSVLDRSARGRFAQAAINALVGDRLDERASDIGIEMAVRRHGGDVPLSRAELAAAFPDATTRLAVFIHGLGEDDTAWRLRADAHDGATYGSRLREDLGLTPVHLRYNTGLHISENGRRLSVLLEDLVAEWPGRAEEIVLIGHSMGGLVARSACHVGASGAMRWPALVRDVVFLGSPHLGAPLEKLVNVGSWTFGVAAESRPLAGILNSRSAGIKDLRFGYVSDEDWDAHEPDSLLRNNRRALPPPAGVTFHHIAATLTSGPTDPVGALAGDLLVRFASATGRGIAAQRTTTRHFGRRTHFDLLNDPAVYEHVRDSLAAGTPGSAQGPSAAP